MKKSAIIIGVALAAAMSTTSFAQGVSAAGQGGEPQLQSGSAGAMPGQVAGAAGAEAAAGAPGTVFQTTLTYRSYPIAVGASAGNLEGAACPANYKMLSGACHPFYNDHVVIINQFPNIPANTWRCGFKNNTAASVTVYIYTLCAQ